MMQRDAEGMRRKCRTRPEEAAGVLSKEERLMLLRLLKKLKQRLKEKSE